jgi:5'-nucleotidase
MRILLTNDDGYLAAGVRAVFASLLNAGHDVVMVAPERNSSGAAQSIAVYNPISITHVEERVYFVTSTPADSVRLGLQVVYGTQDNYPDLIVSGVNLGENIGEDVLYSGTVGAAREGTLHGIPALAFSTNGVSHETHNKFEHLESAARVVTEFVAKVEAKQAQLPAVYIWNINIPNVAYSQILGYETTKLGLRPLHQPLMEQQTPRSTTIYWQGYSSEPEEYEMGTDLEVFVKQQKVSITPIEVLPTNFDQMPLVDALIS